MKAIYSTILFLAAALTTSAQVLLVDQISNATNNGFTAQDFEATYDYYDTRIADDFTVPSGETWYLDSLIIYGFYGGQGNIFTESAGINLSFYTNNSGNIGSLVYDTIVQPNLDPDENGSIKMTWSTAVSLAAGTYWMAASARKNLSNGSGQWYWRMITGTNGAVAKWENPGGGFTGSMSGGGACTQWNPINMSSCANQNATGVAFRMYGCYGPTKPTINNLPDDTIFCAGPSLTLTASSGTSGVNYVWNTGDSTASITVSTTGNYVVTAYNPQTLCGATSNIYVTVITVPGSNLGSDTICPGQSKTYGAGNCQTCSFLWSTGATTNFITVNTQGPVMVTITDNVSGCVRVDSGYLTVEAIPAPQFFPSQVVDRCEGDTVYLTTVQPYAAYVWVSSIWGAPVSNDTLTITQSGEFNVTVTGDNGCSSTGTAYVTFHPYPEPNFTIDYTVTWKTRLTAEPGFQNYLWSTGSTETAIIANVSGVYSLTVTNEFGCTGSTSQYVVVTGLTSLAESGFSCTPNPANASVRIEFPESFSGQKTIELYDAQGRLIQSGTTSLAVYHWPVHEIPEGAYFLRISSATESISTPILIER